MINWNDLSTQIAAGIILAAILTVAGLWKKNYQKVIRWLSARPWAVSTLIAISSAVVAGVIVFVVVETQLAQLKKDLRTISPEASGPAAKLSQVSDLAEALAKVTWIDAEIKQFEDAAKQYDDAYKSGIREHSNLPAELDISAAATIENTARAVLKEDFDLRRHPNFNINHFCCWKPKEGEYIEQDLAETYSMNVDEHNTTIETIHDIRKKLQAQRAKYQAIIDRAAQK